MKKFTTEFLEVKRPKSYLTHLREDEQTFTQGRTSTYLIGYTDGERDKNLDGYYKHDQIKSLVVKK